MAQPTAIVTGASRGIGRAIAIELAKTHRVIGTYRSRPDAAQSLRAETGCETFPCDVARREDREALLRFARERFDTLDVLVNNAGMSPRERRDLLETTEVSFDELIATNLKGPHFLTQQVASWMIRQVNSETHRAIVNISSISATVASVSRASYCLSKAGVSMATRLWAVRLAEFGIGVYEIRPGIVATDMTKGVRQKYDDLIESGLLLERRWGKPEDVGRAVSVLASGELAYATGAVLVLDGGLTIGRL